MISISYSNFKLFVQIHCEAILSYCDEKKTKFRKSKLDYSVGKHFGGIVSDFESLLKASPEKLYELKSQYDQKTKIEKDLIKKELGLLTLYNQFIQDGKKDYYSYNGVRYCSRYLSSKMENFACPYCNESHIYTFNYEHNNKILRRTFDWDHVFPSSIYPFLAISFFNLVPSCKVCNFIKLNQRAEYFNPHTAFNVDDAYKFDIEPINSGFISNSDALKLNIIFKKSLYTDKLKQTISVIGLLERFRCHKDLIKDILNKKRMYSDSYLFRLRNQIIYMQGTSHHELKKTLFSTNFNPLEYYKRPFSKLTADIIKGT